MYLVIGEGFLERIFATRCFPLLMLDGGAEVLEGLGLLLRLVMQNRARRWINAQCRLATGTNNVNRSWCLSHDSSLSKERADTLLSGLSLSTTPAPEHMVCTHF